MNTLFAYNKNQIVFYVIFLTGIALRLVNANQLAFTYDELSALLRTNYSSFTELVKYGIQPDGHPALVQVILYYWIQIVGRSEFWIKVPFIIAGIFTIYYSYKLAIIWSNQTSALLITAFVATSEYTVTYSQIARPYGIGLFFVTVAAYFWSRIIWLNSEKKKDFWLFALFVALAALTHHFALLTVFLLSVSGLFPIHKKIRLKYVMFCLIAVIFYSPHLPIFFAQLNKAGIGEWLAAPTPEFFIDYSKYIFHFTLLVPIIIGVFGLSSFFIAKTYHFPLKNWIHSFLLVILVYSIGYFYSVYVAPTLQFSVLIFVLPFLLIALFGWFQELNVKWNSLFVGVLLLVNVITLVGKRNYYFLTSTDDYKHLLADLDEAKRHDPETLTILFCDFPKLTFYTKNENIGKRHWLLNPDKISIGKFEERIRLYKAKKRHVAIAATSALPEEYYAIIQRYFPKQLKLTNYYLAVTYVGEVSEKQIPYNIKLSKEWSIPSVGTYSKQGWLVRDSIEWGPGIQFKFNDFVKSRNNVIDFYMKVKLINDTIVPLIQFQCKYKDSLLVYRLVGGNDYRKDRNGYYHIFGSHRFSEFKYFNQYPINAEIYVWNVGKKSILISDFQVHIRKGNPNIYGLFYSIE